MDLVAEASSEMVSSMLTSVLESAPDAAPSVDHVSSEVVEAAGGRVELVNLKPGASTTGLIERIRRGTRTCPPTADG